MNDAKEYLDTLTGLANRIGLEKKLSELEGNSKNQKIGILLLAMSRFSAVTDSVGAALGDKVILMTAKRLRKIFTNAEIIARTHGDHFCLLFLGDFEIAEQIRLVNDFTQRPLAMRGEIIVLSVRVGSALAESGSESPAILLSKAEIALHRAKKDQVNACFYNETYKTEARASHKLENDLRVSLINNHAELHRGISNSEFRLLYQPIVDTTAHKVIAFEALIRWQHPTRGFVSPADFIPMAESIQVLDVLGSWVFKKACEDAANFPKNSDGSSIGVSINVSATQFINPDILLTTAQDAIRSSGIEPQLVKIEITESAALGAKMIDTVVKLKEIGFKLSLDDFGTGYSSLTQLNDLPLDFIKLDRSFVQHIGGKDEFESERAIRMTNSILSLADSMNITPIVEGIEHELQLNIVCNAGAHLIQGYHFSKPLPFDDAVQFAKSFEKIQRCN
jgi:diguanylate cyclase (GGDEF)-like protein